MSSIVDDDLSRQTTFRSDAVVYMIDQNEEENEEDKQIDTDVVYTAKKEISYADMKTDRKDEVLESLRKLQPARKKLSSLETQRIMGVLENAVQNILIITSLPSAMNRLDDLSIVFTRNLVKIVENYKALKLTFDEYSAKMDALKGIRQDRVKELESFQRDQTLASEDFWTQKSTASASSNEKYYEEFGIKCYEFTDKEIEQFRSEEENIQQEYEQFKKQVQHAIKCLLIGFKSNPAAVNVLTVSENDRNIKRSPGDFKLIDKIKKLKDIVATKLMTSPLEQDEINNEVRNTHKKFQANEKVIAELELQLNGLQQKMNTEVQSKNDVIRKLQREIYAVKKTAEENQKRIRNEMERQIENDEKNSESVCQKLQQEIYKKKLEYNQLLKTALADEKEKRAEKYKFEDILKGELEKYDIAMSENLTEFESKEEAFNEEKQQLEEIEERFKTLSEEYEAIMEERRIAEEMRLAKKQEEENLTRAVVVIQSFWRSYKERKGLRGKKKGKGKGKKKK